MTAQGTGGDVAGVEDMQVEAQVGKVEVHGVCLWFLLCLGWPHREQAHSYKGSAANTKL